MKSGFTGQKWGAAVLAAVCAVSWTQPAFGLRQTSVQESPPQEDKLKEALLTKPEGNHGVFSGGVYRPQSRVAASAGLEEVDPTLLVDLDRVSQLPMRLNLADLSLFFPSAVVRPEEVAVTTQAGRVISREYRGIRLEAGAAPVDLEYKVQVVAAWDPLRLGTAEEYIRKVQPAVVPAPPGSPPPSAEPPSLPAVYRVLHGRGYLYVQIRSAENPALIRQIFQIELRTGSQGVIPPPPPDSRIVLVTFNPYSDQPLVIESVAPARRVTADQGQVEGRGSAGPGAPGSGETAGSGTNLPARFLVAAVLPAEGTPSSVLPAAAAEGLQIGPSAVVPAGTGGDRPENSLELPPIQPVSPVPVTAFGLNQGEPLFQLTQRAVGPDFLTPAVSRPGTVPGNPFQTFFVPVERPLFPPAGFIPARQLPVSLNEPPLALVPAVSVAPPPPVALETVLDVPFDLPDAVETISALADIPQAENIELILPGRVESLNARTAGPEEIRFGVEKIFQLNPGIEAIRIVAAAGGGLKVEPVPFTQGPVFPESALAVETALERIIAFGLVGFRSVEFELPEATRRISLRGASEAEIRQLLGRVAPVLQEGFPGLVRLEGNLQERVIRVTAVSPLPPGPVSVDEAVELVTRFRPAGLRQVIVSLLDMGDRRLDVAAVGRIGVAQVIRQVAADTRVRGPFRELVRIEPIGPAISDGLRIAAAAGFEEPPGVVAEVVPDVEDLIGVPLAPADAVEAIVTIGRGGEIETAIFSVPDVRRDLQIDLRGTVSDRRIREAVGQVINARPGTEAVRLLKVAGNPRQIQVTGVPVIEGPVFPDNAMTVETAVERLIQYGRAGFQAAVIELPEGEERVNLAAVRPEQVRGLVGRVAGIEGQGRLSGVVRLERVGTERVIRVTAVPAIPEAVGVEEAVDLVTGLRSAGLREIVLTVSGAAAERVDLEIVGRMGIEERIGRVAAGAGVPVEQPIRIEPIGPAISDGLRIAAAAGFEEPPGVVAEVVPDVEDLIGVP
ncbi:MAG: hypothetical protein NC819_02745, partial [Candidatus Omnitrophica bacterium]|nr:hypothetical protein [Candidatus Omnitrophota bacterium]